MYNVLKQINKLVKTNYFKNTVNKRFNINIKLGTADIIINNNNIQENSIVSKIFGAMENIES